MFIYLERHARKYRETPSLEAAKNDNPDFEWFQVQDSLDYLIDKFAERLKRRFANDSLIDLAEALEDQKRANQIEIEFLEVARKLVTTVPSEAISRFSDADLRIKEYDRRKKENKPIGVPYGYPTLDRMTGGIMPHELVTVLGFTNIGKSTLLRSFAFNLWSEGYTPLYITLEMEEEVILNIFDAMAASLDYNKLKQLRLPEDQMQNWKEFAKKIKDSVGDIPVIDPKFMPTPDWVAATMMRYKPDVAIIDYVGLMKSSSTSRGLNRYQQLSEITEDLKMTARLLKIPIIMASQTTRAGAKDGADIDNVADAITISHHSDTMIGLYQDDKGEMAARKEMEIRLVKNRLGPRGINFKAVWDFDTMTFAEKPKFERANGKVENNLFIKREIEREQQHV